jgi:hypothetical protein
MSGSQVESDERQHKRSTVTENNVIFFLRVKVKNLLRNLCSLCCGDCHLVTSSESRDRHITHWILLLQYGS